MVMGSRFLLFLALFFFYTVLAIGPVKENSSTIALDGESIDKVHCVMSKPDLSLSDYLDESFQQLVIKSVLESNDIKPYWNYLKKSLESDVLSEAVKSTQKLINQVEFNKVELDNYKHTVEALQKDRGELETSDQFLKSKIEELQREVRHYEENVADKNESVQTPKDEIKEQKELVETLQKDIEELETSDQSLKSKIEELQREIRNYEDATDKNESVQSLKDEIKEQKELVENLQKDIEEMETSDQSLKSKIEELQREIRNYEDATDKNESVQSLKDNIKEQKEVVETLQKDIEERETSDQSLKSKIEELQREVRHYEEDVADKNESVQSLKDEIKEQKELVETLQKDIEELESSDQLLKSNIEELQRKVRNYEDVADKNESIQTLKDETKEQNKVVEALNFKISDVHSTVEDSEKAQRNQEQQILDLSKEKSMVVEELGATKSIIEHDKNVKNVSDLYNEIDRLKCAQKNEVMQLRCEHTRLEEKLLSKSEACEKWSSEVNHLREEIFHKERQLDEWRMRCDDASRVKVQMGGHQEHPTIPDLQYIQNENNGLKVKVVHYQKSILDLEETFATKEEEYRQRIFLLESQVEKQNMLRDYEVFGEKLVRIQSCLEEEKQLRQLQTQSSQQQMIQLSFTHVCLLQKYRSSAIDQRISNSRAELEQALADLAESAKTREALMHDLKHGNKNPSEEPRYQKCDLYNQKLHSISMNKNEKDEIVKRLGKTQEEMKRLEAENVELLGDNSICKNENAKLASRILCYQNELGTLNDAKNEKKIIEKENKRLANLVQDYEEKLRKANQELDDFDQIKRKTIKLECRLESRDRERASLDKTILNMEKELKFYRRSSRMLSSGCCFELNIKKEQFKNNVEQLEQNSELLENQISTLQGSLNLTNEAHSTQYVELQKLLERSQLENEELRRRAKDNLEKHQRRSTLEQPSVNVHVHLDPQTLQPRRNEPGTLLRESVGMKHTDVVCTSSEATEGSDASKMEIDIQELTKHKKQMTEQLETARKEIQDLQNTQEASLLEKQLKEEELAVAHKKIQELQNAQGKGDNQVTSPPKKQLVKQVDVARKEIKELKEAQDKDENQIQSLQQALDACLVEKNELLQVKEEMELEIEEFESKKHKMVEKMMKMRCLFDDKQTEWEENEEEWKKCEEKKISELNGLRAQLQTFSRTDADIQTLQNKIQDLSDKKEKSEALIGRLREEKSELKMTVDKLERELINTKQKLEFQKTQRAQLRRNAASVVETSEPFNETTALVEKSKPNPVWLSSAKSNARDFQQVADVPQQKKQNSIRLTSNEPEQEKGSTSAEQPSTRTRHRPLGTADGFGEDLLTTPPPKQPSSTNTPQQPKQEPKQHENTSNTQQGRRALGTADGFGEIYITALKPQTNTPQQPNSDTHNKNNTPNTPQRLQNKTSSEQQKQGNRMRRGVSVQNIKANPGFLDDFADYTPKGMVLPPQNSKPKK